MPEFDSGCKVRGNLLTQRRVGSIAAGEGATLYMQRSELRSSMIAALLVCIAMVLGGGGTPAALAELGVELIAAALFAGWVLLAPGAGFTATKHAWLLAAAVLIIPLVQLIPLPPPLWHEMPGRGDQRAALALVGAAADWRPWSVAPSRTLASLLATMVPVVILLMTASLGIRSRTIVAGAVAGTSVLAVLVGVAQKSAGESNAFRFYVADVGYLNGFQANHNSAADVLLIGMVASAVVVRGLIELRRSSGTGLNRLAAAGGIILFFSVSIFLTASRAGAALLPLAWVGVLAVIQPRLRLSRGQAITAGLATAATAIVGGLLLARNGVVGSVVARYSFEGEFRPELWRDAVFVLRQYLPFGSGMGSFVPVFISGERLEVVDATLPNRAHNDYLELLIEAGVFGAAVLSLVSSMLARRFWVAMRQDAGMVRCHAIFAATALAIIAAHSFVDYPLRSISLACIAAVAAGLLMPLPDRARPLIVK